MHFGKGGQPPLFDSRDYQWSELGFASAPFDWTIGYDVQNESGKLTIKNQNGSGSCGGQAWAYYGQMLDYKTGEKSAKFIYAQTFVAGGGSDGRTNSELVKNKGWGQELLTPSYNQGNPPTEDFMERPQDITPQAFTQALTDRAYSYANALGGTIDTYAQAVRDNKGVIFGITGQDNGSWLSKFPQPPMGSTGLWFHWVYLCGAEIINGKKYLKFANSWGESTGENGFQYIGEEYLKWIFSAWTLVELIPPPTTFKHHFTQHMGFGASGAEVTALQKALAIDGEFKVPPSGYFGLITLGAVMAFQNKYGIITTGFVGDLTNAQLNKLFQ